MLPAAVVPQPARQMRGDGGCRTPYEQRRDHAQRHAPHREARPGVPVGEQRLAQHVGQVGRRRPDDERDPSNRRGHRIFTGSTIAECEGNVRGTAL
ncbi:hypothetical protein GCM10010439_23060 [Actinocorallia aurantiaca]|uniref:Uncharacterized protein n=1 Tax=Actinocorallia aurantiaca TaxID=46204 RepID=A0ABP6GJ87_9ACTN